MFLKSQSNLVKLEQSHKLKWDYRHVLVSDLDRINDFIENGKDKLSDHDVKKIIGKLEGYVTN